MPVMLGQAQQLNVSRSSDGSPKQFRLLRDGTQIVVPWQQALIFEGRGFGIHAGTVTTPLAGHSSITAIQPDVAVYFAATGTSALPIYITGTQEAGGTTLATGGMMCAISNINVGAGTSTPVTPFNLKMTNSGGISTAAAAAQVYSGNGTDPLTAGNYLELQRVTSLIDQDAATSGLIMNRLEWNSVGGNFSPVVEDIGSILFYDEAAANTFFATILWAELPSSALG